MTAWRVMVAVLLGLPVPTPPAVPGLVHRIRTVTYQHCGGFKP